MSADLSLRPGSLDLSDLMRMHAGGHRLMLGEPDRGAVRASAALVQGLAQGEAPVYGVNTGFGKLADKRIGASELDALQRNLIRSHLSLIHI